MKTLPKMIDMARKPKERDETASPMVSAMPSEPTHPYGLCIRLEEEELEKLGLNHDEVEVGDMLEITGLAKVTSVSSSDNTYGKSRTVELQITHIADEDEEEGEEESETKKKPKKKLTYGG